MRSPQPPNRPELCIFCPSRGTFCGEFGGPLPKVEFVGTGMYLVDEMGGRTDILDIEQRTSDLPAYQQQTISQTFSGAIGRRIAACNLNATYHRTEGQGIVDRPPVAYECPALDERVLKKYMAGLIYKATLGKAEPSISLDDMPHIGSTSTNDPENAEGEDAGDEATS